MQDTVEQALVSPRYLADGSDPGWVSVPLHRACGWSYGHDPLMPHVILTSRDQQATLRIDPDLDEPWWTIRHARIGDQPAWSATFGARTPVEIIAAVADALTAPRPTAGLRTAPLRPPATGRMAHRPGPCPARPDRLGRALRRLCQLVLRGPAR